MPEDLHPPVLSRRSLSPPSHRFQCGFSNGKNKSLTLGSLDRYAPPLPFVKRRNSWRCGRVLVTSAHKRPVNDRRRGYPRLPGSVDEKIAVGPTRDRQKQKCDLSSTGMCGVLRQQYHSGAQRKLPGGNATPLLPATFMGKSIDPYLQKE